MCVIINTMCTLVRRCNSALSEVAAFIALQATVQLVARHRATIAANVKEANAFFGSRINKFASHAPDGGSIAFPRLITGLRYSILAKGSPNGS